MIIATVAHMGAEQRSRGAVPDDTASATIRVACPGKAHETGEECLICDEDNDGTISVIVTELELAALAAVAQGRHLDRSLEPRLRLLRLVHDVAGCCLPTERGYALLRVSVGAN